MAGLMDPNPKPFLGAPEAWQNQAPIPYDTNASAAPTTPAPTGATPAPATPAVAKAGVTNIDPSVRTVDPSKETVAGQLEGLMKKDSGLMTLARTGATQTANQRGMVNSSMAAGAGEKAAIESALPIATSDASVYGAKSQDNQNAINQARGINAGAANTASLSDAAAANSMTLQQMQTEGAKVIAKMEADYKVLMQTSASAGQIMASAQAGINAILANPDMSNAAKAALINKIESGMKAQMGVIGAINQMDLSSLLVFPPAIAFDASAAPPVTTPPVGFLARLRQLEDKSAGGTWQAGTYVPNRGGGWGGSGSGYGGNYTINY